jgi:hypothetical protein
MTETDEKMNFAAEHGIPPYLWLPPEKPPLRITNNKRAGYPFPPSNLPDCQDIAKRDFEQTPGEEHPAAGGKLTKNPHPLSDFSHLHEYDSSGSRHPDFGKLKIKFDPKSEKEQRDDLDYLEQIQQQVGPDAPGFQRMKMAFDVIVCQIHTIFSVLNEAIKAGSQKDYTEARDAYLELVENLDNREPEHEPGGVNPKKGFGYGKNFKWVFIDPIIESKHYPDLKADYNVITGTVIILKWNPHSSSSGIPVSA